MVAQAIIQILLQKKKQSNQIAVFGQILSMGWPVIMIT